MSLVSCTVAWERAVTYLLHTTFIYKSGSILPLTPKRDRMATDENCHRPSLTHWDIIHVMKEVIIWKQDVLLNPLCTQTISTSIKIPWLLTITLAELDGVEDQLVPIIGSSIHG